MEGGSVTSQLSKDTRLYEQRRVRTKVTLRFVTSSHKDSMWIPIDWSMEEHNVNCTNLKHERTSGVAEK